MNDVASSIFERGQAAGNDTMTGLDFISSLGDAAPAPDPVAAPRPKTAAAH